MNTEELLERRRRLADQHGETVDRRQPGGSRRLEERSIGRRGDNVVNDTAGWGVAEVECQRRLTRHAERTGVDDQVEATGPVVEREIGRAGKMVERDRMMLARR